MVTDLLWLVPTRMSPKASAGGVTVTVDWALVPDTWMVSGLEAVLSVTLMVAASSPTDFGVKST